MALASAAWLALAAMVAPSSCSALIQVRLYQVPSERKSSRAVKITSRDLSWNLIDSMFAAPA